MKETIYLTMQPNWELKNQYVIFLVKNVNPYAASSSVKGLVNDFGDGITSKYSLLNAKSERNNSLKVGVKQIYQGAWNTIGGFSDAYSINIYSNIADSPYSLDIHLQEKLFQ